MHLLVFKCLIETTTECGGSIRKTQERQRHQFSREQLVVGKEVQEASAFLFPLETMNSRKVRFAGSLRFETQFSRTAWCGRRQQWRTGRIIGDVCGRLEFFLQRRGE